MQNTNEYIEDLKEHIKQKYSPIFSELEGTVTFHLILDRSGALVLLDKVESSGYETLDECAEGTIKSSLPYKDFPEDSLETFIKIELPIKFKRNEQNGSREV